MSTRAGLKKVAVGLGLLLAASLTVPVADVAAKDGKGRESKGKESKAKKSPRSQGGGGMEIDIGLGEEQTVVGKSPERLAFERAQAQMSAEDYKNAVVGFADLLNKKDAAEFHEQAEYLVAKALYRMGYYHSALNHFIAILAKGEKHKYFKTSKEWLFFISRKTADQAVVAEEIARYSGDNLPEKFADEFNFTLAKLYFRKAGEVVEAPEKGGDAPAGDNKKETPAGEDAKPDEGGDMEFGTDALGGGGDVPAGNWRTGSPSDGLEFDMDDLGGKPKKGKGKKKPERKKTQRAQPKHAAEPSKQEKPPQTEETDTSTDTSLEIGVGGEGLEMESPAEKPKTEPSAVDIPAAPKPAEKPSLGDRPSTLQKCVDHASKVRNTSKLFLKATYLKAVCLYELEKFEGAVESFREVVRLTNPKNGKFKNPAMREQAFFSLARTHYSFQQFRAAIFYYDRISRDSTAWLDALFESSWAYFRLGDYEKALGNLVTLHSPFFSNEYFPESHILKAVTYYENCRYPEALGILTEFEARYGGLRDELDRLTKDAKTPDDYYKLLKSLEKRGDATALTTRLIKLAKTDKNLDMMAASAKELEAEEQRILAAPQPMSGTPLVAQMLESVKKRRQELTAAAGAIARAKLEGERDELKSLSSQLYRIQFEITKSAKEKLEATLRGEKQGTTLGKYRFSAAVSDEHIYWPFDGEYWRDELGTYEYTLAKGCRQ